MSGQSTPALAMSTTIKIDAESTGFVGRDDDPVAGLEAETRPLSMAWISDELLAETIDVWSEAYGRLINEQEAVEILMNVKRLGEVMAKATQEMNRK